MKHLENNEVMNSAKSAYVKPTMEVYEMEMEGAILQSSAQDRDYEEWSKADVTPLESPINQSYNA